MAEITDFGTKKTVLILAIVVGCFAVLWPKIFYPMINSTVNPPRTIDGSTCCDVIFESDVTAVDIMQELCRNILKHHQIDPRIRDALNTKITPQSTSLCREEVLARCGIDLSSFLAERERLGKTYKQVLEDIRTLNSSLCLKTYYGIPLSRLGMPHLIRYHILMPHNPIKQERRTPPHAGGLHPALRERGRAIPSSHIVPRVVDRTDNGAQKIRPPLGGAGHGGNQHKGSNPMGVIMPVYTIGIVVFFFYTIIKVLKRNTDGETVSEFPGVDAEKEFRKRVFSPDILTSAMTGGRCQYQRDRSPSPIGRVPTIEELKDQAAGDIEIDQLRRRLVETEAAMERIVVQMGNISRSVVHSSSSQADSKKDEDEDEFKKNEDSQSPSVKVLGMEMTACCEGGQKCTSRPTTPIFPEKSIQVEREKTPPVPIYLEGALPPQCELLVTDSETQEQKAEEDAEAAVVISSKMTLSLISLDQTAAEAEEKTRQILRESVIRETGQISERTGNITEDEEEEDEVDEDEEVDEEEGEEGEYEEEEYEEEEENKPDGTKTEVIATEEKQIEKDYIEDDEDENIPENLYEKEDYSKNYNINALSTDSSSDDEEL